MKRSIMQFHAFGIKYVANIIELYVKSLSIQVNFVKFAVLDTCL